MAGISTNKTLLDLCEFIIDCEHKTAPIQEIGYPSIRTPNIGKGRLILEGVNRVSEKIYKDWTKRAVPEENDLVLAREAPAGNVAILPKEPKVCLGQRTVLIRPNKKQVEPKYLVYLLLSDFMQNRFLSFSGGATVAHVNMKDIRALKMPPLPSIDIQQNIGYALSAYDDLIENNTRRIKILEEMARLIYREWFVEWNIPVETSRRDVSNKMRKSETPDPGVSTKNKIRLRKATAEEKKVTGKDVFPEGWEVVGLSNMYKTSSGSTPSRNKDEYFKNGIIPWVKTKELRDSFIFDTEEKISQQGFNNSSTKLFPKHTVIMAMYGATIGKLGILSKPATTNQACCAFAPLKEIYSFPYLFLYLYLNRIKIISLGSGAAQQNVSQDVIKDFQLVKPDDATIKQFNTIVVKMFEWIEILQEKNINLRQTRDLLLPKLISGEVEV